MVNVNKKMLPMKGHYFLFNAGTAPVVPFMPTLAKQLGFSSVTVGFIYSVLPIVGMLAKPLFGLIGDRSQKHKLLFIIAQIISAISLFSIIFIPSVPRNSTVEFTCHGGENVIKYCPKEPKMDECIGKELKTFYKEKSIDCSLSCMTKSDYWNIICDNWGVFDKNSCPYTNSSVDLFTNISIDHTQDFTSCLYFLLPKAIISGKLSTMYCPKNGTFFKTNCNIKCSDQFIQNLLTETVIDDENNNQMLQFWMFFLLMIVGWSGMAVVVSVGDAICFEMLGERHHDYGNQRMWGAIGWGVLSIISGILVDKMSGGSVIKDYTIVFYLSLIIIFMDIIVSLKLNHKQVKLSRNILKDVGKLFLVPRIIIYFVWCIAVGLCTALVWNLLFWYLEELAKDYQNCESKNYMKTLQGLAMGVQCFGGELPFFFLSSRILKKIGHIHAMSLVLFGFGVRFILYSFLQNPWWVLPIELMNGITFGIFYSTMASYASIVAPPGTEATLQGLVGAVFEGPGVATGSFIGGVLFKVIGGRMTFLLFGICSLVLFFVHIFVQWLLERHERHHGVTSTYSVPTDSVHILKEQDRRYQLYDDECDFNL